MAKYRKRQAIDSLKEGVRVDDVFVVKMKKGFSQYAKGFSFHLVLTDASGRSIDYRFWGGQDEAAVRRIYDSVPSDGVVLVRGKAAKYMDKLQVATNEPDTIAPVAAGDYDPADFIPGAKADIDEMWGRLTGLVEGVRDPGIKALLRRIFLQSEAGERFKRHPGAIEIHHNWVGGLLQHTLEVAEYALLSKKHFPELDEDLIVAGALLHDIGKLEELEATTRIKGTRRGQLEGHIALGYAMAIKAMDELGTPDPARGKLLHILLSHHGCEEYGSPKPPMLPEAYAIHHADAASSQVASIIEYVKWAKDSTEDEFMYHKRHGHNILLD
jgi:3'-5' exoribonuclease